MAEINYEIKKHIGVISPCKADGWRRELNIVSWNNGEPKYDIREWNADHTRMGRGITLTEGEGIAIMRLLREELC